MGIPGLVDTGLMPVLKGSVHVCATEKPMFRVRVFIGDGATGQGEGCEPPRISDTKQMNHSHYVYNLS